MGRAHTVENAMMMAMIERRIFFFLQDQPVQNPHRRWGVFIGLVFDCSGMAAPKIRRAADGNGDQRCDSPASDMVQLHIDYSPR
jgi:hypothetical protein